MDFDVEVVVDGTSSSNGDNVTNDNGDMTEAEQHLLHHVASCSHVSVGV